MIQVIPEPIRNYLDSLVPERSAELKEMEAYALEHDFPIIGPACGHLCYLIARMTRARNIFELGSGFGYSTAFFAQAVSENGGGAVHHVVWDEDLSQRARKLLSNMGYDAVVQYHMGEAVQTLAETDRQFDIIFNDIDKNAYPASLPVIESKLRTGGVLIIDNMLWSGRIFDDNDQAPDTAGVREFTRLITTSPNWITSLVPIRDGMIVALKGMSRVMGTTRLEAFSDAVIAIVMTIMVLELKVPHEATLASLAPIGSIFASYALSFVNLAIYWNNHHHMMQVAEHVDGAVLWANMYLLFWLSLIPFATGWMGENQFASTPTAAYGFVLLMSAVAYFLLQRAIISRDGPDSLLAKAVGTDSKGKLSPLLYLVAIPLAFVSPLISGALYIVVAIMWMIPDRRIENVLPEEEPV